MARPTIFREEMLKQAKDYINGGYKDHGDLIPSIMGLSKLLNIDRSTLYDWGSKKDHQFSGILEICNAEQCRILINNGLSGDYNSNIVKLVLGKHGFSEKSENKNTNFNVTIGDDDAGTL